MEFTGLITSSQTLWSCALFLNETRIKLAWKVIKISGSSLYTISFNFRREMFVVLSAYFQKMKKKVCCRIMRRTFHLSFCRRLLKYFVALFYYLKISAKQGLCFNGLKFLMAVPMNSTTFWYVTPCSPLVAYRRFENVLHPLSGSTRRQVSCCLRKSNFHLLQSYPNICNLSQFQIITSYL
jgi:hypothetical protein